MFTAPAISQICQSSKMCDWFHNFKALTFLLLCLKMSSSTETQIMRSVITTFCCTNWAHRSHMPNYTEYICIQLLARNIWSEITRLCWNLISPPEWSDHSLWSRVRCSTLALKMLRGSSLTCPSPKYFMSFSVFHLTNFTSRLSNFFPSSFFPSLSSSHLWLFSPRFLLSPPESWGIITQSAGWHFIHYHIKGFLMPRWLTHCYSYGPGWLTTWPSRFCSCHRVRPAETDAGNLICFLLAGRLFLPEMYN